MGFDVGDALLGESVHRKPSDSSFTVPSDHRVVYDHPPPALLIGMNPRSSRITPAASAPLDAT